MSEQVNGEALLETLEFVSEREQTLFAQAQLGEQLRDFLATPAGRYLFGRAQIEIAKCKDELLEIDEHLLGDEEIAMQVRKIKRRAWCAEHFIVWLSEAIGEGDLAFNQLEDEEL